MSGTASAAPRQISTTTSTGWEFRSQRGATPPQFSAGLGLGVEFKLTPWLGLYLDPAFRYYFRPDLQPRSLRTIQPLRFDVEAGLRFSLGK